MVVERLKRYWMIQFVESVEGISLASSGRSIRG